MAYDIKHTTCNRCGKAFTYRYESPSRYCEACTTVIERRRARRRL